jgi:uncharacterized protein with HEPN domain
VKEDKFYLIHILECIKKIEEYTSTGKDTFMNSSIQQDAVLRNLEIIGEAVKHLSSSLKESYPDTPWRQVAGLRDLLIHHYMGVDLDEVWNIVVRDIPPFRAVVMIVCNEFQDER